MPCEARSPGYQAPNAFKSTCTKVCRRRRLKRQPHLAQHALTATSGHHLHHLLHLAELIEKLVDILGTGAAAAGDASPPASSDYLWLMAFIRRHRQDDRFNLLERIIVHPFGGHLLLEI